MAGRNRSTKARAQRIDRSYFHRRFPLQRWRWNLAIGFTAVGLLWAGAHVVTRNNTAYSPGPLTPAHALLNQKCTACHAGSGAFTLKVTDQSCSACHQGSIHQASQTFTPQCVDCHTEHTSGKIATVSDQQCAQCHSDLKVKSGTISGTIKVAAHIESFTNDHPEFSPQRLNAKDPGTIKFNHSVHLKKELRGPKGNVTLACSDCHRTDNREPWPWGKTDDTVAASTGTKYMGPVNYYEHCSTCHPLTFDRRFSEPVPHKDPAVVHDFLTKKFTAWIAAHPEELRGTPDDGIRIPGRTPAAPPRNAAAWIAARVEESEQLMRVKTCKECHDLAPAEHGIPAITKANLTSRWLPKGEFDHSAHQMLVCDGCHKDVNKSAKTSDVLLPGIAVCRECHVSGKQDAANGNCAECHVYHDPAARKHLDGKYTLQQITELR